MAEAEIQNSQQSAQESQQRAQDSQRRARIRELEEEIERYRHASEDALQQLDWCIGYVHGSGIDWLPSRAVSIGDSDRLRHGGMGRLFSGRRRCWAPSCTRLPMVMSGRSNGLRPLHSGRPVLRGHARPEADRYARHALTLTASRRSIART